MRFYKTLYLLPLFFGFSLHCYGSQNSFKVLHSFAEHDGTGFSNDYSLHLDNSEHKLYATTKYGGQKQRGKLFSINTNVPFALQMIYEFDQDDISFPVGKIALSKNKQFVYGIANNVIYRMKKASSPNSSLEKIHEFTLGNQKGYYPTHGVVLTSDGKFLYGITTNSGAYYHGILYRIALTKDGFPFELIHSFSGGIDGSKPVTLIKSPDDQYLYGTMESGGSYGCGGVFQFALNPASRPRLQMLASFQYCGLSDDAPTTLMISPNGQYLYGANESGFGIYDGSFEYGGGYLYKINLHDTFPKLHILHRFRGRYAGKNYGELASPSSLELSNDGETLYGATSRGGKKDCGVLYQVKIPANDDHILSDNEVRTLHEFNCYEDGHSPLGLILDQTNKILYGNTIWGGEKQKGVIFKYDLNV